MVGSAFDALNDLELSLDELAVMSSDLRAELHDRRVSCRLEGLDSHRLIGNHTSGLQHLA